MKCRVSAYWLLCEYHEYLNTRYFNAHQTSTYTGCTGFLSWRKFILLNEGIIILGKEGFLLTLMISGFFPSDKNGVKSTARKYIYIMIKIFVG